MTTNSIVRVNMTTPVYYPRCLGTLAHPEFENLGVPELDVSKLCFAIPPYLEEHPRGGLSGTDWYGFLERIDITKHCLGYRELKAIQGMDIESFRTHFKGRGLMAWRSVFNQKGTHPTSLKVFQLFEDQEKLLIDYMSLGAMFNIENLAAWYPT